MVGWSITQSNLLERTQSFKKVGFFLFVCCYFSVLVHSNGCAETCQLVHAELTLQEEEDLKVFFHYLFAENELGYTLFDDKPVSFCFLPTGAPAISVKDRTFKIYKKGSLPLLSGVKAWNKIKSFKGNSNYIFLITEKNGLPELAFLINKEAFAHTFNENVDLFKHAYGQKVTAESFLERFENNEINVKELLQSHWQLGVLLGYGRHNSMLFQRRETLLEGRKEIPWNPQANPSLEFDSLEAELLFLDQHLQPVFIGNRFLQQVVPVNFSGDLDSLETFLLQTHYKTVHRELSLLFSDANWFQMILERLCN